MKKKVISILTAALMAATMTSVNMSVVFAAPTTDTGHNATKVGTHVGSLDKKKGEIKVEYEKIRRW